MKRKVLPARLCMEMKEKAFSQGIVWKCEGTGLLTKQHRILPCIRCVGSHTGLGVARPPVSARGNTKEINGCSALQGRVSLQIGSITPCLSHLKLRGGVSRGLRCTVMHTLDIFRHWWKLLNFQSRDFSVIQRAAFWSPDVSFSFSGQEECYSHI